MPLNKQAAAELDALDAKKAADAAAKAKPAAAAAPKKKKVSFSLTIKIMTSFDVTSVLRWDIRTISH